MSEMPVGPPCPDCRDGHHAGCTGGSWDVELDEPAVCSCWVDGHPDSARPDVDPSGAIDTTEEGRRMDAFEARLGWGRDDGQG